MKKHKIIPLNIFFVLFVLFFNGGGGWKYFFSLKGIRFKKKNLLCDHKVRLYHHLDLYNS